MNNMPRNSLIFLGGPAVVCLLLLSAVSHAAAGQEAGPAAYYTMDADKVNGATVQDSSGNSLNGVIQGGVTAVPGKIGQALQFDGKGGYIQVGGDARTALADDLTIMVWVKTEGKRSETIASRYESSGSEIGYVFKTAADGTLALRLGGGNNLSGKFFEVSDGANKVNDGQWHHAAIVIKLGLDVQFYVDGGLSSVHSVGSLPGGKDTSLTIGRGATGSASFTGAMDDVRIYPRAVSSAEIAKIFGGPVTTKPAGETLYNGIVLYKDFPPNRAPTQQYHLPTWVTNPPLVIPIDIGRQLFVDDFLIEKTDLTRSVHRPVMPDGPLLKNALPFSGGVWYDPADKTFKMWYGGYKAYLYATSKDGRVWDKSPLPDAIIPNTNAVLPGGDTIWLDLEEKDPARRFKAFCQHVGEEQLWVYFSPNGIKWTRWPHNGVTLGDRTTAFYNPFRGVWVNSMRRNAAVGATSLREAYEGRGRYYSETRDLVKWNHAMPRDTFYTAPDDHDPIYAGPGGEPPQLYNLDAVAYESLMVGMFSFFHSGKGYKDEGKKPGPILVELNVGFSRDGFDWVRPTRGVADQAFIPASNKEGTWNAYNTQSVGGCFLVMGDELWFYFTGRTLKKPKSGDESTGLATLRRDGFYSMDAGAAEGMLTTRPVRFSGKHMFVNIDNPTGRLKVEALDAEGNVMAPFTKANCAAVSVDKTLQKITWNGAEDLAPLAGKAVKFRFNLTQGKLYSFWVTPSAAGASNGYVAAGGPGFTGVKDTGETAKR
jgi:hypothetical protein